MIQGPQTDVISYKRVETCLNPKSLPLPFLLQPSDRAATSSRVGIQRRRRPARWLPNPAPREAWPACAAAVARHRLGAGAPAAGPWEPGGGLRGPRAEAPVGAPQAGCRAAPQAERRLMSEKERECDLSRVLRPDSTYLYSIRLVRGPPIVTNG